jgi:hypothetical protein
MSNKFRLFALVPIVAGCMLTACGPLRLDDTPQIRGTLVSVDAATVGLRHKAGQTYYVEITRDTRIVNSRHPGNVTLCPGQRATVFLAGARRFTASSITLWSGDCK